MLAFCLLAGTEAATAEAAKIAAGTKKTALMLPSNDSIYGPSLEVLVQDIKSFGEAHSMRDGFFAATKVSHFRNFFPEKNRSYCQLNVVSCYALHQAAQALVSGPVLEIGTFCGCSTSCIASGLRHRAKAIDRIPLQHAKVEFTSADLFLESRAEFNSYGFMGHIPLKGGHSSFLDLLDAGGYRPIYERHLKRLGLFEQVDHVVKGDFMKTVPPKPMALVVADVTHSRQHEVAPEVQRNLKKIIERYTTRGSNTLFFFHDLSVEDAEAFVTTHSDVIRHSARIENEYLWSGYHAMQTY
mmetsp:Transcript_25179/g.79464  ORF Transcript_25179/g.79464 Transcript_25179/m.79464 type:complete len:298 (+) Transcript_25179:67-960(+)